MYESIRQALHYTVPTVPTTILKSKDLEGGIVDTSPVRATGVPLSSPPPTLHSFRDISNRSISRDILYLFIYHANYWYHVTSSIYLSSTLTIAVKPGWLSCESVVSFIASEFLNDIIRGGSADPLNSLLGGEDPWTTTESSPTSKLRKRSCKTLFSIDDPIKTKFQLHSVLEA